MKAAGPWVLLIVLIAGGAAALRSADLDARLMHGDEAVNAMKFKALFEDGVYEYNPHQYHGPALYYALWPVAEMFGPKAWVDIGPTTYRSVTVIFGVLVILALLLIGDAIGWPATAAAALLTALSTSMAFISGYFIHEMLLVAFTFGAIAMGWRYTRSRHVAWAIGFGACIGLMFATKETTIVSWFAMGVAAAVARCGRKIKPSHVIATLASAVVVSVVLFSSLGTHWRGVIDALHAFDDYAKRGLGDAAHTHPWWYYLRLLTWHRIAPGPVWSEGLIVVLAIIGALAGWRSTWLTDAQRRFVRFMAVYALVMAVVYSAIPYKTPWLAITFVQPAIVLAGVGVVAVMRCTPTRAGKVIAALLLAALTVQLGQQTFRAIGRFDEDQRNPYVYAHPSPDLRRLVDYVDAIAAVHPDGRNMVVKVVIANPWPLPWYLRRFNRVGYWNQPPTDGDGDVVIVQWDPYDAATDLALPTTAAMSDPQAYAVSSHGLRHGVIVNVFVKQPWYNAFTKTRE